LHDDERNAGNSRISGGLLALIDGHIHIGFAHQDAVQNSVPQRPRELDWQAQVGMAAGECNNRRTHKAWLLASISEAFVVPAEPNSAAGMTGGAAENHATMYRCVVCILA